MPDELIGRGTLKQAQLFISFPSQSLVIGGPSGIGKSRLADYIASKLLLLDTLNYARYPYKLNIGKDDGEVGIEAVRSLEHFLSLKVPSKNNFNRVVIFRRADELAIEAQNALLKVLEEPPAHSLVILCSSHSLALLPTVLSRCHQLTMSPPSQQEAVAYFTAKGFSKEKVDTIYNMCAGLPELMEAVLSDQDHQMLEATRQARQILTQSVYERLQQVDELSKNKKLALAICFVLQQMAHLSLLGSDSQTSRWLKVLRLSYQTEAALLRHVQPKLVLTDLFLSL